ncbi:hypothetical protein niasHT_035014 [Heterodera trifolii]|uniref:Uncharacterized protein n=1 Tax=Heterodera trifolii TaxID=157864 RepID=A0ABD2INM9_9BILA
MPMPTKQIPNSTTTAHALVTEDEDQRIMKWTKVEDCFELSPAYNLYRGMVKSHKNGLPKNGGCLVHVIIVTYACAWI